MYVVGVVWRGDVGDSEDGLLTSWIGERVGRAPASRSMSRKRATLRIGWPYSSTRTAAPRPVESRSQTP